MCHKFSIALLIAVCTIPCLAERLQTSYFNKDLSPVLEVLQGNKKTVSLEKTNSETIITSTPSDSFNGFVGLDLQAQQLTWRTYYHWWNLSTVLRGHTLSGRFTLKIKCFDKEGILLEEVELKSSTNTGPLSVNFSKSCIPVPKCRINDPSHNVEYFYLGLAFENWQGRVNIQNLQIEKYHLTEKAKQPYTLQNNKARVGAMAWFDPSYRPMGTATQAMRDTAHKLFAVAGMNKMRFMALWGDHFRKHVSFRVEPTFETEKGKYGFEKLDDYINELDYYGNRIGVLTLWGTPTWAHSKTTKDIPEYKLKSPRASDAIDNATFPPDNWGDYRRFVEKMVERYKGKIDAYEVWNEPDVWQYGMTYGYESYIDYLKQFYIAAKKADPDSIVYAGRIAIWLVPCLKEGDIQHYCDAIVDHPYPGRMAGWKASKARMEELIKSMVSQDVVKPLVVTEVGLGAGYPWPGPGGFPGEQAKAENAKLLVEKLSAYTREIYWYTPIQSGRAYGILHYSNDRYRPNPIYYTFAEHNGILNNTAAPVNAVVELPEEPVKKGQISVIKVTAVNRSDTTEKIQFWPVGLIDDLGYTGFDAIRKYDKTLILQPGETHSRTIRIVPDDSAFGKYPVGLAVINEKANSLALKELPVWSIAATSDVSASSCEQGSPLAVNSLFEPVWSGDIDIPRLIWAQKDLERTEWIQLDFDDTYSISKIKVYWAANPRPRLHFPELEYDTIVTPESWTVYYRENGQWKKIDTKTPYETKPNQYNEISFSPVNTKAVKIEAKLKPNKKAGVLQVKLN